MNRDFFTLLGSIFLLLLTFRGQIKLTFMRIQYTIHVFNTINLDKVWSNQALLNQM